MSQNATDLELFRSSLQRATEDTNFYGAFYDRFISSSPEMGKIFKNKDMHRLQSKLRMTLEMVMDNAADQPGTRMYLEMLGRLHAGLEVSERHFGLWKQAALDTAAESDPGFDDDTRKAWEAVIDSLVARILAGRTGTA
jgi:hemoglobin-like flavoprotein